MSRQDEGWASCLQGETYRTVFDESCEPMLIMRGDRFVDGNQASMRLLDYPSKREFLRRDREPHPADLSPERQPDGRRSRDKAEEIMSIAKVVGRHQFDWTHLDAHGAPVPVEVCLVSLAGRVPDASLMAVSWRDRRPAECAHELVGEELRRLERLAAVGKRATQLVHDLNNMMTAVRGCAELLRTESPQEPADKEALDGILTAVDTASSWSRDLLRFVSGSGENRRPTRADLGRLAERLAPLLGQLAGPDVEVHVAATSSPVAAAESDLEQLLVNLVGNAADAMPAGGEVFVNVGPDRQVPGMLCLEVRDNGAGMAAEQAARAFEPFYSTKAKGTGLGLASVRAIAEAAGGSVELASELGAGTAVVVRLPARGPVI